MVSDVTRRKFLGTAGTMVAAAGAVSAAAAEPAETARAKPIKIVGICCSPRHEKTTAASLAICLEAARTAADTESDTESLVFGGKSCKMWKLQPTERRCRLATTPSLGTT